MKQAQDIVSRVRQVIGTREGTVGLHEPNFAGNEWKYLKECVDTNWVSSAGPFVQKFEKQICKLTGSPYAIVVSNGTIALYLALYALGIGAGDEVLVPALTFVATANAVAQCGAVPHFVDSESEHFGLDVEKLRLHLTNTTEMRQGRCFNKATGRPIVAIVPVHIFGHAVQMDELLELANEFNLLVVEDAAEGLGSSYKGKALGTIAPLGVISFNGNKIVTTGGGGAILVKEQALADRIRHLATTGKQPHAWAFHHDVVAFNFRLPNLNCALGVAQLEQLPQFVEQKRALALRYAQAFEGMHGVRFVKEHQDCRSSYWLNTLVIDGATLEDRNAVIIEAQGQHLQFRPVWELMHTLPMYRENPRMDLSVSEALGRQIINLPSSSFLEKRLG